MTAIRKCVTFKAEFPDDAEESDHGDILIPAGKIVAEAICQGLSELGIVTSTPDQHSFYGWEFNFQIHGIRIVGLLSFPGTWHLTISTRLAWFVMPRTRTEALRQGIENISKVLATDTRFSSPEWMTIAEYDESERARGNALRETLSERSHIKGSGQDKSEG